MRLQLSRIMTPHALLFCGNSVKLPTRVDAGDLNSFFAFPIPQIFIAYCRSSNSSSRYFASEHFEPKNSFLSILGLTSYVKTSASSQRPYWRLIDFSLTTILFPLTYEVQFPKFPDSVYRLRLLYLSNMKW